MNANQNNQYGPKFMHYTDFIIIEIVLSAINAAKLLIVMFVSNLFLFSLLFSLSLFVFYIMCECVYFAVLLLLLFVRSVGRYLSVYEINVFV